MLLRTLDTTLAHKATSLSPELSGTDKRVAGAIIDSFNRKTGQCDPSLNRIARVLQISRRTVIRAVEKLERLRLIRKIRHGGHLHRNSYEPNWARYREIEAAWSLRFHAKHEHSGTTNVSPSEGQTCHVASDEAGTQTLPTNQSKETFPSGSFSDSVGGLNKTIDRKGPSRKESSQTILARRELTTSGRSIDVARAAAERRWSADLNDRYAATPPVYAEVIAAIDVAMQDAATAAEMRRRGAGLAYIDEQLQARGVKASPTGIAAGMSRI